MAYKAESAAETESAEILEDVEEVFDESLIKEEKVEVQGGEGRRAWGLRSLVNIYMKNFGMIW